MTFNSVSFFAFFPLAVLVCWLVPRRWQNAALLAVSYAFYCFNTPAWLPVLVLDSLATWALVRRMDAAEGLSRKRRLWAALGVNLGLLVLLKGASLLLHGAAVSAGLWQHCPVWASPVKRAAALFPSSCRWASAFSRCSPLATPWMYTAKNTRPSRAPVISRCS